LAEGGALSIELHDVLAVLRRKKQARREEVNTLVILSQFGWVIRERARSGVAKSERVGRLISGGSGNRLCCRVVAGCLSLKKKPHLSLNTLRKVISRREMDIPEGLGKIEVTKRLAGT
jgi:hypothetical protein